MDASQDRRTGARWRARQEAVGDIVNLGLGRLGRGFPARTEDVSGSGARVRSAVRLAPGDRIRLAFPSEGLAESALAVEGEVVWVRPPKLRSLGKWMAGVSFRPPEQADIAPLVGRARTLHRLPRDD